MRFVRRIRPGRLAVLVWLASAPFAAGAAAPGRANGPSYEEAMTLDVEELAYRLLGASASLVREVGLPDRQLDAPGFYFLEFAGAPDSAGFRGLCEADTIWVALEAMPGPEPESRRPTLVRVLVTGRLYKIVGEAGDLAATGIVSEAEDLTGSRDADWARLKQRCEQAGPVLWTDRDGHKTDAFFRMISVGEGDRPEDAFFAVRALALAMVSEGSVPLSCREDDQEPSANFCGNARRALQALKLDKVQFLNIMACPDRPATKCVGAQFDRGGGESGPKRVVSVIIQTDAQLIDPPPDRIVIRSVKLYASTDPGH